MGGRGMSSKSGGGGGKAMSPISKMTMAEMRAKVKENNVIIRSTTDLNEKRRVITETADLQREMDRRYNEAEAKATSSAQKTKSASDIGKLSKEARAEYLDKAPVGTKIKGLYSKRTGMEQVVEKHSGYDVVRGGIGAGTRIPKTYWSIGGNEVKGGIAGDLRKAFSGESPYYTTKKPKKGKQ